MVFCFKFVLNNVFVIWWYIYGVVILVIGNSFVMVVCISIVVCLGFKICVSVIYIWFVILILCWFFEINNFDCELNNWVLVYWFNLCSIVV